MAQHVPLAQGEPNANGHNGKLEERLEAVLDLLSSRGLLGRTRKLIVSWTELEIGLAEEKAPVSAGSDEDEDKPRDRKAELLGKVA